MSNGDFVSLVYKIALLVFVGAGVLITFRGRFVKVLTAALLWIVLALVLVVGYTYRYELRDVADRVMAELMPGHVVSRGRTVEVAGGMVNGDFDVTAQINGARVSMVLDTGASSVVLTREDAEPRACRWRCWPIRRTSKPPMGARERRSHARPDRDRRPRGTFGGRVGGPAGPT